MSVHMYCIFGVLLVSRSNIVPVRGNWYLCRFVLLSDWGEAKCNWGEQSDLLEDTCVCQKISLQ